MVEIVRIPASQEGVKIGIAAIVQHVAVNCTASFCQRLGERSLGGTRRLRWAIRLCATNRGFIAVETRQHVSAYVFKKSRDLLAVRSLRKSAYGGIST